MKRPEEILQRAIVQHLRLRLSYDPVSGHFTWRDDVRAGRGRGRVQVPAGSRAGWVDAKGYRRVRVSLGDYRTSIMEHRIAWLLSYGDWPADQVDHINGDKSDNRLCNLRIATNSQNMANRCRHKATLSGVKGVGLDPKTGRWFARIQVNKRRINKTCASKEEAARTYAAWAQEHFGEYARVES